MEVDLLIPSLDRLYNGLIESRPAPARPAAENNVMRTRMMKREHVRAAGFVVLLFALACAPRAAVVSFSEVSEKAYFGATTLTNDGMFILGVEPAEASRPNHPIRWK